MSNIGAMATINKYTEFKQGCQQAYRLFTRRDDLVGLVPQAVHVNKDEFEAGRYTKWVKVGDNGNSLVLPVQPHQDVPGRHVRICTPKPEGEAAW